MIRLKHILFFTLFILSHTNAEELELVDKSGAISIKLEYQIKQNQGNKGLSYTAEINQVKIQNNKGTPLPGTQVEFITTGDENEFEEFNTAFHQFECHYFSKCHLVGDPLYSAVVYSHQYMQQPQLQKIFIRVTLPNGSTLVDPYREYDNKFRLMVKLN